MYTDKLGRVCEFTEVPDEAHRGKVEFHHPISWAVEVGLDLCESHHSLCRSSAYRKKRYPEEMAVNMSLNEIRDAVVKLVHDKVFKAGYDPVDIDKN